MYDDVKKAIRGDKSAFGRVYTEYKDRLYRYALYRLRNTADAEDAVADTIVSAYQQIGSLRRADAFNGWIFRILNATCAQYIDKQRQQRETADIDEWQADSIVAQGFDTAAVELMEALGTLSDQEQRIVLLSVVAGLRSKEIAALTDLTPGAVRSKLSRSLAKMREYWSDAK